MARGHTISTTDFTEAVVALVPDAQRWIAEYWDDERAELLLHPFMFELFTFTKSSYAAGEHETAARVLRVVDDGLTQGDENVQNAVALSFVEHYGAERDETKAFLSTWPQGLRDELTEQRRSDLGRWWKKIRAGRADGAQR